MKIFRYKRLIVLFIGFGFLAVLGCKKEAPLGSSNQSRANTFIKETMSTWYLWKNFIADSLDNEKEDPKQYFNSLLYKKYDRYSYITSNSEAYRKRLQGVTPTAVFGITYRFMDVGDAQKKMVILEVIKGSNADKAQLKRGAIIDSAEGVLLGEGNYKKILSKQTVQFSFRTRPPGGAYHSYNKRISKTVVLREPVALDTVLTLSGKKVGYLYYTTFLGNQAVKLKATFQKFHKSDIQELVVDLRYNGGGYLSNARLFCNAIAPQSAEKKVMYTAQYNSVVDTYYSEKKGDGWNVELFQLPDYNLDLDRVYFLTTARSASASELLINSLSPHMSVVHVGEKTYGKPVGSFAIEDEEGTHNYTLSPIVFTLLNSEGKGEYFKGLDPQIGASDNSVYGLLDPKEPLFKAAVSHMNGQQPFQIPATEIPVSEVLFEDERIPLMMETLEGKHLILEKE